MKSVFANSAWYGRSVIDAHADAVRGIGAGERVDDVEHRLHARGSATTLSRSPSNFSSSSGWLTSPHQMRSSEPGSRTMNLSFGERPVCMPGVDDERPALGEHALLARERVRVQHRRRRIPVDAPDRLEPVLREQQTFAALNRRGHRSYRSERPLSMPHLTPTAVVDGSVVLRPWSAGDADALVLRINDPDIAALPRPRAAAVHDPRRARLFAITAEGWRARHVRRRSGSTSTASTEPSAALGVRFLSEIDEGCAEVGYWVAADARGRGHRDGGDDAAAARWAFDAVPELARLQLRADVENPASNRVAEKAGFTREGVLRAQRYNARLGRRIDFVMWSLLREEL